MSHNPIPITFSTIYHAVETRGLQRALIAPSGTGEIVIVPRVPGRRILLLALHIIASAATNVIFKSNSNAISGLFGCPQEGTISIANALIGAMATAINEDFVIDQSVDGVDGFMTYVEI